MTLPVSIPPAAPRPPVVVRGLLGALLIAADLLTYALCDPDRQSLVVLLPHIAAPVITTTALYGVLRRDGRAAFGALGLALLAVAWIANGMLASAWGGAWGRAAPV
ncbi:hypothetical protein ABZ721_01670 [Streptomyces sp. NPDC006733]|uniref:hypothetical protein n=1 Tax=Streptomyces sp. NPDC006733 TaxID=3155460 RepID=UPI0033E6D023